MPNAIIVDIDGTVAKRIDRHIHAYDKVGEDELHETVAEVIKTLSLAWDVVLLYTSGRPDSCRWETMKWLEKYELPFRPGLDQLLMRKTGDYRKDDLVKREIYEAHIKPFYDVKLVFDDRDRVVKMWREEGLICFQVAEGNF